MTTQLNAEQADILGSISMVAGKAQPDYKPKAQKSSSVPISQTQASTRTSKPVYRSGSVCHEDVSFKWRYPVVSSQEAFVHNVMALFLDSRTAITSTIIFQRFDVQVVTVPKMAGI